MSNMNFTCDVCGREISGCNIVNGMKFCAKCYQETFGETYKKIADLEAKLAEKDKEIEKYRNANMIVLCGRSQGKKHLMEIKIKEIQNQKAIEQLEKVRETINDKYQYLSKLEQQGELTYYGEGAKSLCYLLLKQIEQQINELKGNVEE